MTIEVAYGCHNGRIRKNNEDNFCINGRTLPLLHNGLPQVQMHKVHTAHPLLVGVFDGMGGEEAGEVASFTAASTCAEISLDSDTGPADFLRACCMHMNRAVCAEAEKLVFGRMGTTAALVFFSQNTAYSCNLGDSRVYYRNEGQFMQCSVDHVEPLPPGSRRKAGLMQFLGIPEEDLRLEPHIAALPLRSGDCYLLCSDGLTDMLTDSEIHSILRTHKSTKQAAAKLIEQALQNGGRDNVTVLLCAVK